MGAALVSLTTCLFYLTVFSSPTKRAGQCPQDFLNVVFNSDVDSEPNWPGRFNFLQGHGVSSWSELSGPGDRLYPTNADAPPVGFTESQDKSANSAVNSSQIRMLMTTADVGPAIQLVSNPATAPNYLALFNEPDGGWATAKIAPDEAASAVRPLLQINTKTQFISPAPAYPVSSYGSNTTSPSSAPTWLQQFFAACGSLCEEKISYIAAHIYAVEASLAISMIQNVHSQFRKKHMWVTELAPASNTYSNCNMNANDMSSWMTAVVSFAARSTYVDRVFWNSGDWGTLFPNASQCNPSLTQEGLNAQGQNMAMPLLGTYQSLCG